MTYQPLLDVAVWLPCWIVLAMVYRNAMVKERRK